MNYLPHDKTLDSDHTGDTRLFPFDIEKVKSGYPVIVQHVNDDGSISHTRDVKEVMDLRGTLNSDYPFAAVVFGHIRFFNLAGELDPEYYPVYAPEDTLYRFNDKCILKLKPRYEQRYVLAEPNSDKTNITLQSEVLAINDELVDKLIDMTDGDYDLFPTKMVKISWEAK